MKYVLLFLCLTVVACQNTPKKKLEIKAGVEYTGVASDGQTKTCKHRTDMMCTEIYGPEEKYRDKCRAQGKQIATCGCHDYICIE